MQKGWINVHLFQNRNWGTFHRKDFKWKKIKGYGVSFWKTEALYAELNRRAEEATSSYSATGKFLQYIYSMLVAKNDQKIWPRCLFHRYFLTILIMVTEQLYWRKIICDCICFMWLLAVIVIMKRCTEWCTLLLYCTSLSIFLFQLQCWIILRVWMKFLLRNIHMKRVIMEIAMMMTTV